MNFPVWIAVRKHGRLRLPALVLGLLVPACLMLAPQAGGSSPSLESTPAESVEGYPSSNLRTFQWWLGAVVDPVKSTPPQVDQSSPRLAIVTPGIDVDHPDLAALDIEGARSLGPAADLVGTAVAGIVAGTGGETGTVGIWPGMRLRHASTGSGSCDEAAEAIFGVAREPGPVKVVLLPYSFDGPSCARHLAATQYAVSRGLLVVAPTGNSGPNALGSRGPAADPHVLGVGAIDESLGRADFSVAGPAVDLVAPGKYVFAPSLAGSTRDEVARTYAYLDGTEYAAAMVAAAAGIVAQLRGGLSRSQIEAVLARGSRDLDPEGRDEQFGSGLLKVEGALAAEAPVADKLEPNDDIGWIDGRLLSDGNQPIEASPLWPHDGRKVRTLQATLSPGDPADVYRIRVPARTRLVIGVAQAEGDVQIDLRRQGPAQTIQNEVGVIGVSDLPAPKTEGLAITNRARGARSLYLVVRTGKRSDARSARYQVTVPVRRTSLDGRSASQPAGASLPEEGGDSLLSVVAEEDLAEPCLLGLDAQVGIAAGEGDLLDLLDCEGRLTG